MPFCQVYMKYQYPPGLTASRSSAGWAASGSVAASRRPVELFSYSSTWGGWPQSLLVGWLVTSTIVLRRIALENNVAVDIANEAKAVALLETIAGDATAAGRHQLDAMVGRS